MIVTTDLVAAVSNPLAVTLLAWYWFFHGRPILLLAVAGIFWTNGVAGIYREDYVWAGASLALATAYVIIWWKDDDDFRKRRRKLAKLSGKLKAKFRKITAWRPAPPRVPVPVRG